MEFKGYVLHLNYMLIYIIITWWKNLDEVKICSNRNVMSRHYETINKNNNKISREKHAFINQRQIFIILRISSENKCLENSNDCWDLLRSIYHVLHDEVEWNTVICFLGFLGFNPIKPW